MIDGELAPAATREVMVHADACTECGGFLTALLTQQRIHRALAAGVLRTDQQPALAAAACLPCEAMARGLPRLVSERGALARRP
jgi:anti-sigma factor RsiW